MTAQPPPFPQDPAPRYEGYQPAGMVCPKCRGTMRTFDRNGVHIEQCANCRGVFLDFGELEHLIQLENRFSTPPPAQPGYGYGPDWGTRGGHQYRRKGLGGLFFSS